MEHLGRKSHANHTVMYTMFLSWSAIHEYRTCIFIWPYIYTTLKGCMKLYVHVFACLFKHVHAYTHIQRTGIYTHMSMIRATPNRRIPNEGQRTKDKGQKTKDKRMPFYTTKNEFLIYRHFLRQHMYSIVQECISSHTFTVQLVRAPVKFMVRSSTYLWTGVVWVPVMVAPSSDVICV